MAAAAVVLSSPFPSRNITTIALIPPPSSTSLPFPPLKHTINPLRCSLAVSPLASPLEPLLDEKEIQALLRHHPQLHSAPPEFLRHRITSLQSLGITGFTLRRAITKCPEILTSLKLDQFLDFIHGNLKDVKPAKIERLLGCAIHSHFFAGFTIRIKLLLEHGIPQEKLAHIINNINAQKVFAEKSVDEIKNMLAFLDRFGGPALCLRRPALLNLDLNEQMIPRYEFLVEIAGGDEDTAGLLIRKVPALLLYTVEHFGSHMDFWRSEGLSDEEVLKIALIYPNIFSASRERKLKPRVAFLRESGLSSQDIFKFLCKAPLFLTLSFEDNLSKKLGLLIKLGYRARTRELVVALGAVTRTSCENMQMVIGLFFSYGLSCEDVLTMSKKHPQVLQYSHLSLEKKLEFLIEDMEREVGELLCFPAFLGYKLDERIKPRYEAKKESRGKGMSLNKLLSVSSQRFSKTGNKQRQDGD
ncbi:transcription termination factor MTERF8, chloroplastic [Dioscorea cayenensis subsp. rotundata]|uniref:Transcription termination factor MTERF8, chloroplastic n=1 Tax=Dioscorea cayennensis subsp. rotundata TaxID=55577 RepID=A0AB40CDT0_DIOCR|nr:transcription termination factor MTERF8, chloroplastic [Dioscorea cayenensis subsp. rotundata]